MRLLLDEYVPKRPKLELLSHEVKTVQDMGWAGIKNGALLTLADGQFDALLTVDQYCQRSASSSGRRHDNNADCETGEILLIIFGTV